MNSQIIDRARAEAARQGRAVAIVPCYTFDRCTRGDVHTIAYLTDPVYAGNRHYDRVTADGTYISAIQ